MAKPRTDGQGNGVVVAEIPEDIKELAVKTGVDLNKVAVTGVHPFPEGGGDGGWSYDPESGQFSMASTLPEDKTSIDLLQEVEDYSNLVGSTEDEKILQLCWELFYKEPMVGGAIETMISLAATRPIVDCRDEKLKAVIKDHWLAKLNHHNLPKEAARTIPGMREFQRQVYLHWYVTGDAVWVEDWDSIKVATGIKTATFPVGSKVHDISTLSILEQFAGTGFEVIGVKVATLSDKLKAAVKNPATPEDRLVAKMLSPAIIKAIKTDAEIAILPGEITWHMSRHRRAGSLHGTRFVRRAFTPVALKRIGQAVDTSILRGMINRLHIIQMGHDDPASKAYHIPKPGRVALLNRILQNVKNYGLVAWAGKDLHSMTISADPKMFEFENRYAAADDMTSLAMAVSRLFIDGQGSGSQQHDWAAFLSMIAKLDYPRSQFEQYLNITARKIRDESGFNSKIDVKVRLQRPNLTDRTAKNIFISAYEKALIGRRDALEELGLDAEAVIDNQLEETEKKWNELIQPPNVPYTVNQPADPGKPAPDEGRPEGPADAGVRAEEEPEDPMLAGWKAHLGEVFGAVEAGFFGLFDSSGNASALKGVAGAMLPDVFGRIGRSYMETRLMAKVGKDDSRAAELAAWTTALAAEETARLQKGVTAICKTRKEISAEVLKGAIACVLAEGKKRMGSLVGDVAKKGIWAGEISRQSSAYVGAEVRLPEGATCSCEKCSKHNGEYLSAEELWEEFPCSCGSVLEFHWCEYDEAGAE